VTNFSMKPRERFAPLGRQTELVAALSSGVDDGRSRARLGVDFGSIGLCHVAAGFTDAMVEFAKGFAPWDLMPGHYVLSAVGGVVVDLDGVLVPLAAGLDSDEDLARTMALRQRFVAARTPELARELASLITR
jgi:myo-inositol-1(or 4)-monophosphatase